MTIHLFSANNYAQSNKRKTLTAADVFQGLEDMEFEAFVDPLKSCLERKYSRDLTEGLWWVQIGISKGSGGVEG